MPGARRVRKGMTGRGHGSMRAAGKGRGEAKPTSYADKHGMERAPMPQPPKTKRGDVIESA